MTCIVGLVDDGNVYMGADSAGSDGYTIEYRADPKLFTNNGYLMGFTTSFRMGQILHHNFDPSPPEGNPYAHMVKTFIPEAMEALHNNIWLKNKDAKAEGGTFMVGFDGRLFTVYDDFQVAEIKSGINSVGSGAAYALGSLYATRKIDMLPKDRVKQALEAAAHFSPSVAKPFLIKKV